jgi:hypothetical protein
MTAGESWNGGESREFVYRALSSGMSANILDFRLPQKHLLGDVKHLLGDVMMETGYRAGAGEGQAY